MKNSDRVKMWVHKDFHHMLKVQAAVEHKKVIPMTKEIANKLTDLPKNDKKRFNFRIL